MATQTVSDIDHKQKILSDFFMCVICHDVMSHPYTIVDCLHKFDKDCLAEYWKQSNCCPLCKVQATKASHDFTAQVLIESTSGITSPPRDNAPIFPYGLLSLGSSRGFSNDILDDEEEEENEDDDVPMGPYPGLQLFHQQVRVGGDLIFPCESCPPGNNTGYECPWPIPMPSAQEIGAESQRVGIPIRAPIMGEARAPLPADDDGVAVNAHLQCDGCSIYVPRGYPAPIRCTNCRKVCCAQYTNQPDCSGISLFPAHDLHYKGDTIYNIAEGFPLNVQRNREEMSRFESYLQTHGITASMILRHVVEANEAAFELTQDDALAIESQGARRSNPWTDAVLCNGCIESLVRIQAGPWQWWMRERETGDLDPVLQLLPNCWYGYECRTQIKPAHESTHAARHNHICPRTRR